MMGARGALFLLFSAVYDINAFTEANVRFEMDGDEVIVTPDFAGEGLWEARINTKDREKLMLVEANLRDLQRAIEGVAQKGWK